MKIFWIRSALALSLMTVFACGDDDDGMTPTPDAAFEDGGGEGAACEPLGVIYGDETGQASCIEVSDLEGVPGREARVRVNCTDAEITALLHKPHLIMVPEEVSRETLWLHLGGSGGTPPNTQNIGLVAASEGYRYISLAYPNEPSVAERCSCPTGPRPSNCSGLVAQEILYGRDLTPMFSMDADEAVVPRLQALLRYLHGEQPTGGWDRYLDADGEVVWSLIAVSGFSQGGGMTGLIARDHAVDRTLYFSKGAHSVANLSLDSSEPIACSETSPCERGVCCELDNPFCSGFGDFDTGVCIWPVPAPWALRGRDIDGDGVGDGTAAERATPAGRQFAIVHREEGAWDYSPDVFEHWGVGGGRDTYHDADSGETPPAGTQLFSTAAPPQGASCSEHQSMGNDGCQPKDEAGRPLMAPVWRYVMRAPLSE